MTENISRKFHRGDAENAERTRDGAAGHANERGSSRLFLISAGEASGEMYGAQIMAALRQQTPNAEFFGAGGGQMQSAGCDLVVQASDIAVVGITEVVRHIPKIYRKFRKLVHELDRRRPAAAILIDFPDFNLRLATECRKRGIPVIYFVSPQVWAWKQGRIPRMRRDITRLLVIFPFEEAFFHKRGMQVEFVGHPLAEAGPPSISREQFAQRYGLDPRKHWIGLLPGSRRKEVKLNLPVMLAAAAQLGAQNEFVLPVASTVDLAWVAERVRDCAPAGRPAPTLVSDARAALRFARASIVASGTATVEAAVAGQPFIVVYRLSNLSYQIARRAVKVTNVGMVNLVAGREIVPELLQEAFTPERVKSELERLIADGPAREKMISDLAEVRRKLRRPDEYPVWRPAVERVADAVLAALNTNESHRSVAEAQ